MGSGRLNQIEAMILHRVDYADSDLILTLLTQSHGKLSAMARAARASRRRFSGRLEPFHTLRCSLESPKSGELFQLREVQIAKTRHGLVNNLFCMMSAGSALRWLSRSLSPLAPEPSIWDLTTRWLDTMDREPPNQSDLADARLADFGLALLSCLGWGLELRQCVRCNTACPPQASSTMEPRLGGLVCRRCGGGSVAVEVAMRHRMNLAAQSGSPSLAPADAKLALQIVTACLHHHLGANID